MSWLNAHSWLMFAYCALALFVAAATLAAHLRLTLIAPRHMYILSVGAVLAGVGAAVAGMQTGADPVIPPADALPVVRVLWALAATCLLGECVIYLLFVGSGLGKSGRRGVKGGDLGAQGAQLDDDGAQFFEDLIDAEPPHGNGTADEEQDQEADEE